MAAQGSMEERLMISFSHDFPILELADDYDVAWFSGSQVSYLRLCRRAKRRNRLIPRTPLVLRARETMYVYDALRC